MNKRGVRHSRLPIGKRGVSEIVATVLIIMITVAAIGIIWAGIIPLVKDNLGSSDVCKNADISIETTQGYTCWDSNQNITAVHIKKGSNDVNVSGLKFYLSSGGNSVSFAKDVSFEKNSFVIFYLNSSRISKLDKIEIVPILKSGNSQKDCGPVFIKNVGLCGSAGFSASEIAQLINETNTNSPGVPSSDSVYPQFFSNLDNSPGSVVGTGGAITTILVGGQSYTVHTFLSSGTFTPPTGVASVDYLVVAGGGGGGGGYEGGGGGAGGMLNGTVSVISGSYSVVVGAGGLGKRGTGTTPAANGSNSSFNPGSIITALGGGRGASEAPDAAPGGGNGSIGSGGGGCNSAPGGSNGGNGTTGQGNNGGTGRTASSWQGGGGGGAGSVGQSGVGGMAGGSGLSSSITGSSVTYAAGGNGHARIGPEVGADASPQNSGNGGNAGGGAANLATSNGGKGADGVVIIRYLTPSFIGLFNVTLVNTNGTVLLNINNTNITATNLNGNVYNASYSLSAGSHSYKWYSWGNGSSHLMNVSDTRTFTVA